ncbi:delta-1-pyrroline-5-carboxylate dehydrogenase [Deinococcus proteolyticus MRP]|uniref:L-glutamate gamma-semialdehyde dehydrogenase n=1 Tax=Deinococcus proteolyticus (strain ATCC 35074 / DSM 20540 / JCM 6276 / NBRC 101906 / NCIMB 13154 / VKM Ac-1939 / CCM 2703 / MRP) TaxID=693977 RepID=F0RLV7_DEIPM|nr:L-glutamate gamma-semialdehyde dehydrogenase [Deinococcus proteolyticus]ADY26967.1 delta-1-pyrroline-5-carboxylate dehydrogenase [Deinococcus proteolyticus MRP]
MIKVQEYRPQPFTDFTKEENVKAYQEALAKVRSELVGKHYPLIIDGQRVDTAEKIESRNPCNTDEVVGTTAKATIQDAENALQGAWKAFESWKKWDMDARARILLKAAAILKRRRMEACALMSIEVGKNYAEADVEVAEAIDFLEYYARSAMKYAGFGSSETTWFEGEENGLMSIPLGVGVSISPWNFPCAIFIGMAVAPVVVGNCVIVKPAEDAGLIAGFMMDIMLEAGLPAGVIQFLPGVGKEVGEYLTTHAKTRFITFTGSRAVGLHINEVAAKVQPGQKWIKRVVMELGGKDALIVDETADIETAVTAAAQGAFGFNGQKCSAMSRLIVVDSVYDDVVGQFVERARSLKMGTGEENAPVTAVVNQMSFDKIKSYLELAPSEGQVLLGGEAPGECGGQPGYYIAPTIVGDVQRDARMAQEEIFGPVVTVLRAKDWQDALDIANSTEYGLTGGVISNSRERLEQAREEFEVGNLYFNRKITGAIVGVQPFGGYNMSGTDSKAGGPDYLANFMQLKTVTERW